MAAVGEIYYHKNENRLRIEVTQVNGDRYVWARTIATHHQDSYPVGALREWNLRDFILDVPLTSSCDCYWDRHPLLCKCKKG